MAIDPNLFLNPDAIGDFNDSSPNTSGYGILSGAELNQTYFAYYDGAGRQDPELPKQTTFFIKYLIDSDGNIVKPQPNDTSVINIVDNFETGKPVIITTKTPTVALNPLLGEKIVTHVGELSTLLVTNTGSGKFDYITTMSFQNLLGIQLAQTASDYNMTVRASTGSYSMVSPLFTQILTFPSFATTYTGSFNLKELGFTLVDNSPSPAGTWDSTNASYTFNTTTNPDGNSRVKFRISVNAKVRYYKWNSFVAYQSLGIEAYREDNDYHENKIRFIVRNNGIVIGISSWVVVNNQQSSYPHYDTPFFNFLSGDVITFEIQVSQKWPLEPGIDSDLNSVIFYTQQQGGTSKIQTINENQNLSGLIDGATGTTANFFTIGEYPDQNGTPEAIYTSTSVITASQGLTNMYREGTVQTLPSSALAALYMQPWQSFYPLLPGDRIIFENNKNNVHTITEVIPSVTASNNSSSFGLRVVPGIPTGSIINNFCIYRILNNGSQIMIDQEKPTGTADLSFRGFIRPKYISQELETKFIDIINKLEADGTIT
jgi:hypothetical protein